MRPVIHVVDDEKDSADVLAMVLGLRLPYAMVQAAYGGTAALALAFRQPPHVAVLDLEMQGLTARLWHVSRRPPSRSPHRCLSPCRATWSASRRWTLAAHSIIE